uniref:Uncharacterized protein n=1 Tax=Rhizophora mucronata TaxID=61149 RepID=A0A2P2PVC4_RHIMU
MPSYLCCFDHIL